ncbi:MAG: sulfurtransferase [Candidatus Eremiobacteraeota bacterium]|nr:sulfurtransferase [Candidatus Eremiobacteraeota bacterium]
MTFTTIISPEQLHERLGSSGLAIFDCRHSLADFALGRRLYDESHIPGAFFADAEIDLSGAKTGTNGRHPLPDPESLARFLRVRGVGDDTQIVAYDDGGDIFAPRFWFLARWIGHDAVAVLDGGLSAWKARGYPVTAARVQPVREGALTIRLHPEYVVEAAYVQQHLRRDDMQLIDARANDRYSGAAGGGMDPVAGHIPGAKNRCFEENFRPDGTLKSPQELRADFERAGFDPKRTVHQCGSGVSATVNHLAMQHAGLEGSRVYNGSWSEWISDPSRPIATGSEP